MQNKIRLVLLFGSIYQHFTFLQTATFFGCFFLFLKYRCSVSFKCKVAFRAPLSETTWCYLV